MLASLLAATLVGLEGRVIRVEVDVAPGMPGFTIVGLGDASVREARERVRGAIRNAGFVHPPRRITVNLAPADLPKTGSGADLAIAIGILVGSEQFTPRPGRVGLVGELSLGGEVRRLPGLLPMVAALARRGIARVIVPAEALSEASLVSSIEVVGAATLGDVVDSLRARRRTGPSRFARVDLSAAGVTSGVTSATSATPATPERGLAHPPEDVPDLAEVRGQAEARRALEVALAGGHGLLLVGPPGTGKTLLARTIPGLLPPLPDEEALAATIVASAAGEGPIEGLVRRPPFRAPHHTTSYAAMVGGGPHLTPGEVTRADGGILFLDELAEFSRDVLEALRQPLEDGRVEIVRAGRSAALPARFQLVAAMNPCPCGHAGSDTDLCRCGDPLIDRYQRRISGPLRDRIDLWVGMPRMRASLMLAAPEPESSAAVALRIATARDRQRARPGRQLNARVSGRMLRRLAGLTPDTAGCLTRLAEAERLSGRGTDRVLRVARTIADLDGAEAVDVGHLEEAARWRAPASRPMAALAV
jgi:magnesium chelatase family protein